MSRRNGNARRRRSAPELNLDNLRLAANRSARRNRPAAGSLEPVGDRTPDNRLNPCGDVGCKLRRDKCQRRLDNGVHYGQRVLELPCETTPFTAWLPNFCGDPECRLVPIVCYEVHFAARPPRHHCPSGSCELTEIRCEARAITASRQAAGLPSAS